jgi:hypothetical protein
MSTRGANFSDEVTKCLISFDIPVFLCDNPVNLGALMRPNAAHECHDD